MNTNNSQQAGYDTNSSQASHNTNSSFLKEKSHDRNSCSDSQNNHDRNMANSLKPIILIFAIIGILLVSGCVGQKDISGSASGIVIKNIYTDPQQDMIETGSNLNIYYELENIGGTTARDVKSTIYGMTWIDEIDRLNKYCIPLEKCNNGLSLYPPDPVTKSSGGIETVAFIDIKLKENLLPSGLRKTFPLKIRASYNYETSGTVSLEAYSKKRYNRDIQLGNQALITAESSIPVQTTIAGTPISVSISGPDKIIVNDAIVGKESKTKYTYHITFTNIGEGYPISHDNDTISGSNDEKYLGEGLLRVKEFRIEGPGVNVYSCLDYDANEFRTALEKSPSELTIKLRGRSVTKSCTIEILNKPGQDDQSRITWNNREFNPINLYFDLTYRYFVEKDFSITVTAPVSQ
ncbi:MAG: hypothetical protein HZB65_03250 [Candidatus Aenigmarchaeota archaeon]|nr:hypothetical protein [Candidatus Aenigmarchaeota archaeon]